MAKRQRRLSVTQQIMQDVDAKLKSKNYPNHKTYRQFLRHSYKYVQYCRENFDCRDYESCCNMEIAQSYADELVNQGYSASTIHTYLAAISRSMTGINLKDINKPSRYTSEYTRGRKEPFAPCKAFDLQHEEHRYLCEFQRRVGIRRDELKKLKGSDMVLDESYYWCVRVRVGKGGKKNQLNRLNTDEDAEFVRRYFEGKGPDELIFAPEMFNNHLNLHKLRADSAREFYFLNLKKMQEDPEHAARMDQEIKARWNLYNIDKRTGKPKLFKPELVEGEYILRGRNREFARKNNLPVKFSKLCLLYTSVMKLSHWRLGIACNNYINILH